MNTMEYVSAVQAQENAIGNISKTARLFGVSRKAVYDWIDAGSTFSDEHAIIAADLLGLPHEVVILDIEIERTKCHAARDALSRVLGHIRNIRNNSEGISIMLSTMFPVPTWRRC